MRTTFAAFALASLVVADSTPSTSTANTLEKRTTSSVSQSTSSWWCTWIGLSCNLDSDIFNCGTRGNVCPVLANVLNGKGTACNDGVCGATCNTLFDWNTNTKQCQNVASDVNNCGKCGQTCSIPGATGYKCATGTCLATRCGSGYSLSGGTCNKVVDTTSDPKNCGKVGNQCASSWSHGNGATCENSVCRATTCDSGYDWDYSAKICRDVSSDKNNCGKCGNQCSFPNGSGSCKSGSCTLESCASNFYNIAGTCTRLDLSTDNNNCGAVGTKCSFTNGQGSCQNKKCTYSSCTAPWALIDNSCQWVNLNTDPSNCGKVGNACPSSYSNGGRGFCSGGKCQTVCGVLHDFDFDFGFCRDVSTDKNNCGKCGAKCTLTGASATQCTSGTCSATQCATGYKLVSGTCQAVDTTCDDQNCGSFGFQCNFSPSGAKGVCQNSKCVITSCPAKYHLVNGACVPNSSPSQRARLAKKDVKVEKRTLCPTGETACPILGAASFGAGAAQFGVGRAARGSEAGGYECLDTMEALDSCGGCASTGEGVDCTKIKGAVGVGCDQGACVVFSCKAGFRPNIAGTKCVRTRHSHSGASTNGTSSTSSNGRRHLHARHQTHHHG